MTLFEQLQQQVKELLSTSAGCPWMLQQNWRSIAQYSLEEVYELMDAIVRDDKPAVCDELADLCLHLLIYAEFGRQEGAFTWNDIVQAALDKQKQRRNPGELNGQTAEEAHALWQQEKLNNKPQHSLIADLPHYMPPLMELSKIEKILLSLGFYDVSLEGQLRSLDEAYQQLLQSYGTSSSTLAADAANLLAILVRMMTHAGHDMSVALSEHNHQLRLRLESFEQQVTLHHGSITALSRDKRKALWRAANDVD